MTIKPFIGNQRLLKLSNGWISNGHWAVDPKLMPKFFRDRIAKETEMQEIDIRSILNNLEGKRFMKVFPVDLPESEREIHKKNQILLYGPEDHSFLMGFNRNYLNWFLKNFPKLEVMAYDPGRAAWLCEGGIFNRKIGLLMPKRI